MAQRFTFILRGIFVVMATIPLALFGADPVGRPAGGGSSIDWIPAISGHESVQLTVLAPDGEVTMKVFSAGRAMTFRLQDLGNEILDGEYNYELLVIPKVSKGVAMQLEHARSINDDKGAKKVMRDNGLNVTVAQSGSFTVLNGSIISTDLPEGGSATPGAASDSNDGGGSSGRSGGSRPGNVQTDDQVIPDDLIVQGSACIGLDCVNNESFGFDTIRMKENNTRIKFDDTSTSAGFSLNDWQLTANDSASGGSSKFSIEDITGAKVPFTLQAAAPTNSIFVDSTGRVGFRTSTPVLDLHVATSNTPALRFEQNNAGGFTAQTWDVAGNEANFFVRDVTGGSRLPFRIRPGAPTSSIDISANGDVGIGTAGPTEKLHVFENSNENTLLTVQNPNAGDMAAGVVRAQADVARVNFQAHGSGRTISRFGQALASWNEMLAVNGNGLIFGTLSATPIILGTNNIARLTIAGNGAVTIPGNLTVSGVKNFAVADPADPNRAIYYTALEGPEAGTYYRGSAKTVNGEAVIVLPGHFARLTEKERMTVQLTPVGAWGQLYVAEKTPERLVIRVAEGGADLEFDYLVQGVRTGYLEYEVERTGVFPVAQQQ